MTNPLWTSMLEMAKNKQIENKASAFKFKIEIELDGVEEIHVTVFCLDNRLSQQHVMAWLLPKGKMFLAFRLACAVHAGAVLLDPEIKISNGGKNYLSTRCVVRGRCMNADLCSLGY